MELSRIFDEGKFMWDGRIYDNLEELRKTGQMYQNDGFSIREIEENKKYFLFSRRVVKEVIIEGKLA